MDLQRKPTHPQVVFPLNFSNKLFITRCLFPTLLSSFHYMHSPHCRCHRYSFLAIISTMLPFYLWPSTNKRKQNSYISSLPVAHSSKPASINHAAETSLPAYALPACGNPVYCAISLAVYPSKQSPVTCVSIYLLTLYNLPLIAYHLHVAVQVSSVEPPFKISAAHLRAAWMGLHYPSAYLAPSNFHLPVQHQTSLSIFIWLPTVSSVLICMRWFFFWCVVDFDIA